MTTPEYFQRHEKVESADDQKRLEELTAAAEAARTAGVYNPSETEGEN